MRFPDIFVCTIPVMAKRKESGIAAGAKRETLVFLNFEDERLSGVDASALSYLLEEYYRQFPLV